MNYLYTGLSVFLLTCGGVTMSLLSRGGRVPAWATLPFTLGAAILWAWQTKYGRIPLLHASALFDVVASSTWFLGFALFDKTPLTGVQGLGLGVILLGMLMLNLGGAR